MKKKLIVVQKEDDPIPAEVIAQAIIDIGDSMKKLSETRLKRSAIVALIHDKSKINKTVIEIVLNNLEQLEDTWLKTK